MKTAVVCSALMGFMLFALGLYVSTKRGRTQQIGTTPQNPADPLFKAIRAHGNTAEFVPMLAILMLYIGSQSPAGWVLGLMVIVTVCRFLIVFGIILSPTLDQPHPLRLIGALGTYFGGALLSIVALLAA